MKWLWLLKVIAISLTAFTFVSEVSLIIYSWSHLGSKGIGPIVSSFILILFSLLVFVGWSRLVHISPAQGAPQIPQLPGGGEQQVESPQLNSNGYPPNPYSAYDADVKAVMINAPPRIPPYQYRKYKPYEARCFIAPKEGDNPTISDDKYAMVPQRYALADGAGTSFQPARWAEVLVNNYIQRPQDFMAQQDFNSWLKRCSKEWEHRVRTEWLPHVELADWEDPDAMIAQGAQSTFIGCILREEKEGQTYAHIVTIGDANFFLFRPSEYNGIKCEEAYPLKQVERSSYTDTLASTIAESKLLRAWQARKIPRPRLVQHGDYIVLATDEMAIWLLKRVNDMENGQIRLRSEQDLQKVLSMTDEQAFQKFVADERRNGRMELDDTTMLIIPVHSTRDVR